MTHPVRRLILLILLAALPVRGEIFSLWPFGNGSAGSTPFNEHGDVFPSKNFWKEEVRFNGVSLRMDIALVDMPFADAGAVLRKRFPRAGFAAGHGSLLVNQPEKDGSALRLWLISLRGVNPVLLFSLKVPPGLKNTPESAWPKGIPILPGAKAGNVISFPSRGADFASFTAKGVTRPQALDEMARRLQAEGWLPASEEIANPFRASGEVFYRESPLSILLLGVSAETRDGILVTVYTRPVEKKK